MDFISIHLCSGENRRGMGGCFLHDRIRVSEVCGKGKMEPHRENDTPALAGHM